MKWLDVLQDLNTDSSRPSYKNPEKWPKNLSGISPKMLLKSPVSPLKTPQKLLKISKNPMIF